MLVLSRKINEVITIGNDITITVTEIRGDKVRLGIQAPKNVEVWRGELMDIPVVRQRVRYIIALTPDMWLGDVADDGHYYERDKAKAYKFATEAEAGAALAIERRIAPWKHATIEPVNVH